MSFLTHEENGLVWLTSPLLSGVRHGFSTRQGGVSQPPFDTMNLAPGGGMTPPPFRKTTGDSAAPWEWPLPAQC